MYKSKNLTTFKNRANATKGTTMGQVNDALGKLTEFNKGVKKLNEMNKSNQQLQQDVNLLSTYMQYSDMNKEESAMEYDKYKRRFMENVGKSGMNYTFPEFDDFYKNRTLGTIDGIEYSPSDFIDPFDKEKLNTILNNMGN